MPMICPYCESAHSDTICNECGENHNVEVTDEEFEFLTAMDLSVNDLEDKRAELNAWLQTIEGSK